MSDYPEDRRYTKSHEWVQVNGDVATLGITDYAQEELGEIVFVELPEAGESFGNEDEFGTIESVKAVSELYMPLGAEIVEKNAALDDEPSKVNEDPHGAGWLLKVRFAPETDPESLLSAADYRAYLAEEAKSS